MKIHQIFDADKVFFSADTHLNHWNINAYCKRGFSTVEEMDNALIASWNKKVPKDGIVFHLGDFSLDDKRKTWENWLKQLNGNIYHIQGNHDMLKIHFDGTINKPIFPNDIMEIKVKEPELEIGYQKIVMCHFPLLTWNGDIRLSFHLYGHCHGSVEHPKPFAMDVGVDSPHCKNFEPFSYEEIKTILTQKYLNKI